VNAPSANGRRVVAGADVPHRLPDAIGRAFGLGLFFRAHRHLGPSPDTGAHAPAGGNPLRDVSETQCSRQGRWRHHRPTSGDVT
jgi:hypothetical protein